MGTAYEELLLTVLERIARRLGGAIPLEIDLWSGDELAAYFKRDRRSVMEKIVCLPSFPRAIRLPSAIGGKGQPLWKAREVIEWAESYQEKRVSRR
jgi:hypothetical protein